MPTATLHLDNVRGYAGPTRCYRLSQPHSFGGGTVSQYAIVCIQPPFPHQAATATVFPGTETGACVERSLRQRGGSFTLHDDYKPGDPVYQDGVCWMALQMLGGYDIEAAA